MPRTPTPKQRTPRRQRTERVPVRLPQMEGVASNWLRSIRFSGVTITALCLLVLAVVVLAPSLRTLVEQRQQIAALQDDLAQQRDAVTSLKHDRARWDDPSYIESLARERLNYVLPGDVSYLVIDDGKTPVTQNGQPISDKLQTTRVDWVSSMLSSVLTAGLTDSPAEKLVAPIISDSTAPGSQ
jgi:cell division protein FtsB